MSYLENQETAPFNFKQKAEKYLSDGKLDEAYANCLKALEISPNSGEIYKILGNIWQKIGQLESAKKSYKQAIQYNPNLAEVYANIGSISARQKQWEQAIKYYEQAISIQPNFAGFYRNLSKIWQCLGEYKLATECRHKALSLETKYDNKINKKEIFSASEVNLLASKTINCQTERVFQSRKVYSQTAFVTVIPGGKGFANVGIIAVMTPENKLVPEVSTGNTELIRALSELPTIHTIEGTVAFLSIKWGKNNYFHWMFDIVTRIYLLRLSNLEIEKIVVNQCHKKFQLETLESLGISQAKIIESENYPYIKAQKLLVPSFSYSDGKYLRIPKWGCNFLRNSFLPEETKEKIYHQTKRIYLSRKKASRRQVINEDKVISCLEKCGFESITLESISVAQQAVLFAGAKFVIAPHGAGLTNLVFCNPGTKVIEIFAPDYLVKYYWIVSNVCGLEHYYLLGEQLEEKYPSEPAKKNIFVNLQKLLSLMKLAEFI